MADALTIAAVAWYVGAALLAGRRPPAGYDCRRHTLSELACQGHPGRAVMQAGFLGFGILLSAACAAGILAGSAGPVAGFLAVWGLCVGASGLYGTAPLDRRGAWSLSESRRHALLAGLGGLAFSCAVLFHALTEGDAVGRVFDLTALALVTGLSMVFGAARAGRLPGVSAGLVQRLMQGSAFLWLLMVTLLD